MLQKIQMLSSPQKARHYLAAVVTAETQCPLPFVLTTLLSTNVQQVLMNVSGHNFFQHGGIQ